MKKALTISVALNLIFITFFAGKRIYYTYGFAKPPAIDWLAIAEQKQQDKCALFNDYPIDSNDIVFVGNSLTEGLPVHEFYSSVKNRGIAGNTIDHVQSRIEQITKGRPKKLFVEIGINDINMHLDLDTIKVKFEKLIATIKLQSPGTVIYIQSLLPTGSQHAGVLPTIKLFNDYLQKFSNYHDITYIDLYEPMAKAGQLDSTLTNDGLHINAKGYEIWRSQIDHHL